MSALRRLNDMPRAKVPASAWEPTQRVLKLWREYITARTTDYNNSLIRQCAEDAVYLAVMFSTRDGTQ